MQEVALKEKYAAYPEYKYSGVEWIGNIPSNWSVFSLKRTVDGCTNGIWGSEPDGTNDITVLRVADFDRNTLKIQESKLTNRAISPKERENRLLKKGDLLIEKSGGGDKTLVGCVVLFDKDFQAVTSNFVAKMTPKKEYDSVFLKYAFHLLYSGRVNFPSIKQTTGIQNLDSDAYLMEYFCFPHKSAQTQITAFLDHETAKIDTLIEKQQQLIELLKEKRQAVISHAVTKGISYEGQPDVPMKDSGGEWLGEVPEHWGVCRIKQVSSFITSGPRGWSDYLTEKGKDIFLQSGDLNNNLGLNFDDAKRVLPPKNTEGIRTKLIQGDIVVCITGANTGRVAITPKLSDTVYINQHLSLIRPIKRLLDSQYLGYLLSSNPIKSYFSVTQYGLKEGLSLSNIAETPVCLPSFKEQKEIVNYLNKCSDNYHVLEVSTNKQIQLLKERRTALISAAVTGKIDVRPPTCHPTGNVEIKQLEPAV